MNLVDDVADTLQQLGYEREVEMADGGQWAKETYPGHSIVVRVSAWRNVVETWHWLTPFPGNASPRWMKIGAHPCSDGLVLMAHICSAESRACKINIVEKKNEVCQRRKLLIQF